MHVCNDIDSFCDGEELGSIHSAIDVSCVNSYCWKVDDVDCDEIDEM